MSEMVTIDNPLVSIIVPVYKVEKYLPKCIESLINQTLKRIEIILVNDGSPDHSLEICERYAQLDSRIRVYSKNNGGLSDARNYGIVCATAPYIGFVDSDDYVDPTMYEYLYSLTQHHHAEIAVCGIKQVDENGTILQVRELKNEVVMNKHDGMKELLRGQNILNSVCNKLFHRDVLNGIEFPVGKLYEDEFFTYKAFHRASVVAAGHDAYYYYFKSNSGSITSGTFSEREMDSLEASLQKIEFCKEEYPDLMYLAEQYLVHDCLFFLSRMPKYSRRYNDSIRKYIRQYLLSYISADTTISGKCFATVAAVSPAISVMIYKLLRGQK